MKKSITLILILMILVLFTGCGNKEKEDPNVPIDNPPIDNPDADTNFILGEYKKNLDILDGDLGAFVSESVYQYINSSFLIEKLGQIKAEDLNSPETLKLLEDTIASFDDLMDITALTDYLLDEELTKLSSLSNKNNRLVRFSNEENDKSDAVKWAEAITGKYDSIKSNQKLKELADYMGTDAKRAYNSLVIAQDILKGEYATEEEKAEEWLAVLNATKTASKVGVYLCATAVTCGATGAITTATTLTSSQTAGIIINGVDCVLTLGSEGANIIYGEDATISKCLATTADIYSKCNYVYGLFNKPDTVGETISFISDTTELINSGVSYCFNVDPLGDGGQLITSVINSSSSDYDSQAIEDLKLGGAYNNPSTSNTFDKIVDNEEEKLVDDLTDKLEVENKEEIINSFKEKHDEESNIIKTDNGLSYKEKDGKYDYCYRNKQGYLDGEKVQYDRDGNYIIERRMYSNGVLIDCKQYASDGLLLYHEYIDTTDPTCIYLINESYYDKDVEDDINYQKRGNLASKTYRSVSYPSKETINTWKTSGCNYVLTGYLKMENYNRYDDKLIDTVTEDQDGTTISYKRFETNDDGDRYLEFESYVNEDGNTIKKYYYEDSKLESFRVEYPEGGSDGEEYEYGSDEEGSYKITKFYTNGEYVSQQKTYESDN